MKSKEEMEKQIETAKNNLVDAEGSNIHYLQGFVNALKWATSEDEGKKK